MNEKLENWANQIDDMEINCKEVFKECRLKLEMSQMQFAKMLKITGGHVSNIEHGRLIPSNRLIKFLYQCMKELE